MGYYKNKLNYEALKQILDCFTVITGIRVVYCGDDNVSINGNNKKMSNFCESIRKYKHLDENCRSCDARAFQLAKESRATYLYTCHMGLWEAVVPLYTKNRLIGYFMMGQVRVELDRELKSAGISDKDNEKIQHEYWDMPQYTREQLEASAKMLELMAQHVINTEIIDVYISQNVEKAKQYVQLHFTQKISTGWLAEELGISRTALCNAFKAQMGMTISEYAAKLRVNVAIELLKTTDLSIKEISAHLKYSDQSYFSRQFKKLSGVSPDKLRNKFT